MGRLAVIGILSISGAFLLQRENLGQIFIAVGSSAVLITMITTPLMRRSPGARWPYYLLCFYDAVALGTIAALSRGAESPFIAFMVAHAFTYGFYLGTKGGITAASATTLALAGTVVFSVYGPSPAKSEMVGTLIEAGHLKLSANYLFAQVALYGALLYASGATGGFLGRMFYSETGRLQQLLDNLAEVRARSRKVLENLRDGVIVVDSRGNLTQANPAAVDILGLPGKNSEALQGTMIENAITQYLTEPNPPDTIELVINDRIIHCRFSPAESDGGVILVLSDVTEAANLRAALEERKRLAIVGRLSATLAHEIRNPLASISGAAEMLSSGKLPGDKTDRMTGIIVSQSKRVSELIDGYLSLARNSEDFSHTPMNLTEFTREAVESAVHGFAGGVTILYPKHDQPAMVKGNSMRLGQALGNLLRNAVEAVSNQPLGVVEVEISINNGEAELSISDNGPGIPAGRLDKAWEPFYTTKDEGTGLGLYICRRVAEEHDGHVRLANRAGGGARASIVLPLLKESNAG